MQGKLKILIVDDSDDDTVMILRRFQREGILVEFARVDSGPDLEKALASGEWHIILADYSMPGFGGPEALSIARLMAPDIPLIVVSGSSSEEEAVEMLRAGAVDYVSKTKLGLLPAAVRRAMAEAAEKKQRREAEARDKKHQRDLRIINELAKRLVSVLDVDLAVDFARTTIRQRFGECLECLYLRQGEMLQCVPRAGEPVCGPPARPGEGLLGRSFSEGRVLEEPIEVSDTEAERYRGGIRLCIPLLVEDEALGVLELSFPADLSPDEVDRDTLGTIADLLAFSLNQARTYEEAELQLAQRIKMEGSLKQSQERYRSFFEHDISGDYISSPEGKILDCNPAFLHILGFASREEAMKFPAARLYPSEKDRSNFIREITEKRSLTSRESEYRRVDGSPVYVIENAFGQFDERGELRSILGYLVDISERKQLEEHLRQAQKMESLGRLAGGISHDFNNLLQAMLSTTESLESRAPEELKEELREERALIRRAAKLTQQLLAFSRSQLLSIETIDLGDHIGKTFSTLRRWIREDQVLDIETSSRKLKINADPVQIDQVLMNLLVNASDATPAGGRITIRCSEWEADDLFLAGRPWVKQRDYVLLEISDSGCGIEEEDLEKIFEPFFTTKGPGKGTGLGLATVYGIVQQHHGGIEVHSSPGEGTSFSIFFPTAAEEIQATSTPSGAHPPLGQGELILFAEDEESVCNSVSRGLRAGGYRVLEARNGREALELFKAHAGEISIAVLDVIMPEMGGAEVRREILKVRPNLPILFSSGYSESAIDQNGILEEGINLLRKPYSLGALFSRLRELIDGAPPGA